MTDTPTYSDSFLSAFDAIVVGIETGTFTDNPRDPGGATKWGITFRTFRQYKGMPVTVDDLQNLDVDGAKDLYYNVFWLPNKCDQLPNWLAFAHFDGCVNQNETEVTKYLQQALHVTDDGVIGSSTLTAASLCDPQDALAGFMSLRAQRYALSTNVGVFGRGWFRRCFDIHRQALELV